MKTMLRGLWRLIQPVRYTSGKSRLALPREYVRFLRSWREFRRAGGDAPFRYLRPTLFDRDPGTQSGGNYYFYQDIWALRRLAAFHPPMHHDVGSRFDGFVGQATALCKIVCWDVRRPGFTLPDFEFREGSVLDLPVPDRSIQSLSCLHVAEHVGLGRYGDPLDFAGTEKTLLSLMRILAPGGQLLFSMPVGRERTEFNAHRIWDPLRPIKVMNELKCTEFSVVDDAGRFMENVKPLDYSTAEYACGLYRFERALEGASVITA